MELKCFIHYLYGYTACEKLGNGSKRGIRSALIQEPG
jgi:hypothetical protein